MDATAKPLRAVESDALIESSFRRLLSAIEAERGSIRGTWQQLQQERDGTTAELERLRNDTEEWCFSEQQKIDAEWKRLDTLTSTLNQLFPPLEEEDLLRINCSGKTFTVPRSTLCSIEGCRFNQLFSEEGIKDIPPGPEPGSIFLDFNPVCFGLVVEYLQNRRLRLDAPLPIIPAAQQKSMELLAEAWKIRPFLRENKINPVHGTSLIVIGLQITATHPGWQVISAQHPLPMAASSYFEVKVLANPDPKGGWCAFGVCTHIPAGQEVHSIRVPESAMYASNNGVIGNMISNEDAENVAKGIKFTEGSTVGIRHDVGSKCIQWYFNKKFLGTSAIKEDMLDKAQTLFPVFALCEPDQMIEVNFNPDEPPSAALMDGRK